MKKLTEDYVKFFKDWCEDVGDFPNVSKHKNVPHIKLVYGLLVESAYPSPFLGNKHGLTEAAKKEIVKTAINLGFKPRDIYKLKHIEDVENNPYAIEYNSYLLRIQKRNYKFLLYKEYSELIKDNSISSKKAYQYLEEKYSKYLSKISIRKTIIASKKNDMTYNQRYVDLKDNITKSAIEFVGLENIKSIIDAFAGEYSIYENGGRLGITFGADTEIITNDLMFPNNVYNCDAKLLLSYFTRSSKKFDLVDLDPFDQPLYYISPENMINMTNKVLIITLGGMERVKTKPAICKLWNIEFKKGCNVVRLIEEKLNKIAKVSCNKSVSLITAGLFRNTYRIAFSIKNL